MGGYPARSLLLCQAIVCALRNRQRVKSRVAGDGIPKRSWCYGVQTIETTTKGDLDHSVWGTVGYGHGVAFSPLHFAAAANAIVNDGLYVAPRLVMAAPASDGTRHRCISPQTSRVMRRLLLQTAEDAGAGMAKPAGFPVWGKAGASLKVQSGRYDHGHLIGWFYGAFPAKDLPRYSLLVMVDEPKLEAKQVGANSVKAIAEQSGAQIIQREAGVLDLVSVEK